MSRARERQREIASFFEEKVDIYDNVHGVQLVCAHNSVFMPTHKNCTIEKEREAGRQARGKEMCIKQFGVPVVVTHLLRLRENWWNNLHIC